MVRGKVKPLKIDRTAVRVLVMLQEEVWEYIQNLFENNIENKVNRAEINAHKDFAELVLMKKLNIEQNGDVTVRISNEDWITDEEDEYVSVRKFIKKSGYADPWDKEPSEDYG